MFLTSNRYCQEIVGRVFKKKCNALYVLSVQIFVEFRVKLGCRNWSDKIWAEEMRFKLFRSELIMGRDTDLRHAIKNYRILTGWSRTLTLLLNRVIGFEWSVYALFAESLSLVLSYRRCLH